MGYKMKGSSLYGHGKKPSVKKTDGIGEGFMNPPYRGPESKGPRAKRQGYDGYTNFTSNVTGRKVHKDPPKSTVHGVDNPGNWQPHSLRKKSPVKIKKEPTGPRAEKKFQSTKDYNTRARMHNTMEIKDRETNPSYRLEFTDDGGFVQRGRMPRPQRPEFPEFRKKSPAKKRGLWDNIHAKRKRGETMRKKGDKGAPTEKAIKESQSPAKMKTKKPSAKKFPKLHEKGTRELPKISNTPKQGTVVTRKKKKSPVKAKDERVKIDGKMYPKGYTKKDVKFLKSQKEDVVRYEDLDAKGRAIWKKQGKAIPKAKAKGAKVSDFDDTVGKSKKSPAKFEEVVPRKMPSPGKTPSPGKMPSPRKTRKTPKRKMPKFPHGAKIPMELKLRKKEGRGPRA